VQITKNINTVVLPAQPGVVSCTKTYALKCTSQATIHYVDTHNANCTQSCNDFTADSDFVNAIDLGVKLEIFQEALAIANGLLNSAGVESASATASTADQFAQFLNGQLGAARCQACCDAFASLNGGIDPSSGLGTAVSKWVPSTSSKSKRGASAPGTTAAPSSDADTKGTCSCCYTKQEETCIRVQDPNYNPNKYKQVPWEFIGSGNKSGNETSSPSSSSSTDEDDKP